MKKQRVIVIGAGMAGLTAARFLMQRGIEVTVLEKSGYVGGRVHTESCAGFDIDTGAQFLANFYTNTQNLLKELNLQDEVVPLTGGTGIPRSGRVYVISGIWQPLFTRLISSSSKLTLLKVLLPVLRHWRNLDIHALYKAYSLDKCSVADYAHRVLNDELLAYILQPPLSGIFYWTPEHTSQAMLFLLLKSALRMKLFTLRDGLGRLPETLAASLPVDCNVEVTSVVSDVSRGYKIEANVEGQKQYLTADGIVCAIPAVTISTIFPDLNSKQRTFFDTIRYSASVNAILGLNNPLSSDMYGLFCPDCEIKYLGAVEVKSVKNPEIAQAGHAVIKLFSSGVAGQALLAEDDENIVSKLWADLLKTGLLPNLDKERLFEHISRWYQALPEFDVGYFKRLKTFADGEIEVGNLVFAGDYLGGPFIEGAITSGLDAARRLLERLGRE